MRSTRTRVALLALALLLAAGGLASAVWLQTAAGPAGPSGAVVRQHTVALPVRSPLLAPAPTGGPVPTRAGLAAALAGPVTDPALGPEVALSVVDAQAGTPLLDVAAATPVLPASTAKLLTATAALEVLGPDRRLRTEVVAGPSPGDVVLVGGGDPTLAGTGARPGYPQPARLLDLARAVRASVGPAAVIRHVLVDDSLFAGPLTGPGWRPDYVGTGNVAPVSALSVDAGRILPDAAPRVTDPALTAGTDFARMIEPNRPVAVTRGRAAPAAPVLGTVESPPVADLVEQMLSTSDNDIAEALARQVGLAAGAPGTFAGGAGSVAAATGRLLGDAVGGVHLVDGSGLSRLDLVPPATLARLLALAAGGAHPELSALLSGLPVAGFSGTLAERYDQGPAALAAGQVRAKTGTLEGVSTLAGLARTHDGRLLAFSIAADKVPLGGVTKAEQALDRVAATLVRCGCR